MAVEAWDSTIRRLEGETWSIGTTATYLALKPGFREVKLYCAADWRLSLCPKLVHALVYTNSSATYVEYVGLGTDRSDATHVPLDALGTSDILYMGVSDPTRGFYFNIGTGANAEAATLDMEYCSAAATQASAPTFSDVASDSDGTASGGATLAVDGVYTFTLPACVRSGLGTLNAPAASVCYWYRFKPSATLSATVDILEIIPVGPNTTYGYMIGGVEYTVHLDLAHVGALVAAHASTSATVNASWIQ